MAPALCRTGLCVRCAPRASIVGWQCSAQTLMGCGRCDQAEVAATKLADSVTELQDTKNKVDNIEGIVASLNVDKINLQKVRSSPLAPAHRAPFAAAPLHPGQPLQAGGVQGRFVCRARRPRRRTRAAGAGGTQHACEPVL